MAGTLTVGQELEGRILDVVQKSNNVTIEGLKVLADAFQPVMTVIPTVTPPLAYDFMERLIVSERKFAEEVLHLTTKFTPAPTK